MNQLKVLKKKQLLILFILKKELFKNFTIEL